MDKDKYAYRVMWSEEDQEYVGLCTEFPSLSWLAKTQHAALKGIQKVVTDVVCDLKKCGEPIPAPIATKQFSGKFIVRVPPQVHRRLALEAQDSKISLNRLVSAKLTQTG